MILYERRWIIVEVTPFSLRSWLVLLGIVSYYLPQIEAWWQQSFWRTVWLTMQP